MARRDRINAHRFVSTRAPKPPDYLQSVSQALELTKTLIARRSVTPADEGCQPIRMERLATAGFAVERLSFGNVENFWARRVAKGPVFCFAGPPHFLPQGPPHRDRWSALIGRRDGTAGVQSLS